MENGMIMFALLNIIMEELIIPLKNAFLKKILTQNAGNICMD